MKKPLNRNRIRAIKIDSVNRVISEIEITAIETQQLNELRDAIGGGYIETGFNWPDRKHVVYVDDEGLLKNPMNFFEIYVSDKDDNIIAHTAQPLAGDGIIVCTSPTGRTVSCRLKLEDVISHVGFISRDQIENDYFKRIGWVGI